MADTTFVNGATLTDADWFNDLNRLHYTILGDPADAAAVKTTLGVAASGANSDITSLSALASINGGPLAGMRNRLLNPFGGEIYQRAVAAAADDTYFCDRHYVLTQTGTVLPSVLTKPEDGFPFGFRLTQSQATAQRFGFAQIIEGKHCVDMRGGSGILVPRIRVSNGQAIRYAILGWTGTEDTVTSDVVLDWTSATFTPGNFFLAANVSVLASGSETPTANTWTSLASIAGALGSTFTNLICMVWTEGVAAQNFTLDLDWWELERGAIAPVYPEFRFGELALCQRYYYQQKSTDINSYFGNSWNDSTTKALGVIPFPVTMRTRPTSLDQSGTAAHYSVRVAGGTYTCSEVPTFAASDAWQGNVTFTVASGLTAGQGSILRSNNSASYLGFSAEI